MEGVSKTAIILKGPSTVAAMADMNWLEMDLIVLVCCVPNLHDNRALEGRRAWV